MTDNYDRFLNLLITFFDRFSKNGNGHWFLDKKTLIEFVINNRLAGKIQIGMIDCDAKEFEKNCVIFNIGFRKLGNYYVLNVRGILVYVILYKNIDRRLILAPKEIVNAVRKRDSTMSRDGMWRYLIDPVKWYNPPIPYLVGTFLDHTYPGWYFDIRYNRPPYTGNDDWFTPKRTDNAIELIGEIRKCAEVAKIEKYMFLGFGTLLGIIRENGFIPTDRDLDHCIMSDMISGEQEEVFLKEVARERTVVDKNGNATKYTHGLREGRSKDVVRRRDNQRFVWTSIGHKKVHGQKGCKSCIWNFFNHGGYSWHAKGRRWINEKKFNGALYHYNEQDETIAKGIPSKYLKEFVEINFKGVKINIPKMAGSCLDEWYPGWPRPKKGASIKKHVMIIPKWKNKATWKVV